VICEHAALGKFELPDRPTYGQLEDYDTTLQAGIKQKAEQTDMQYAGLVVKSAAAAGLIENWQPALHPGVPLTNLRGQDGAIVLWASEEIRAYVKQVKALDPKPWPPSSATSETSETSAETEHALRP
jgi:hypothetical protein